MKKQLILRRSVASTLILMMLFMEIAAPLAYAQQVSPISETPKKAKEITKHTTLLTESESSGPLPYTGERHGIKSIIPSMVDTLDANDSANVILPATVRKLEKENYRPNEEIEVVIENGVTTDYKTELVDGLGTKVAVETEEVVTGDAKVITVTQPSSFRPGRYSIKITDPYGGVSEQDFRWGVLAINPDKSVYAPNETANLAIAVLDDAGNMVCDAQVELEVRSAKGDVSSLSTDNGKVKVNPECESHDFTLNPDYEATYKVGGEGRYEMTLKAQTQRGAYEITDSFTVKESVPFDVKRVTATRIYPPHTYPVTMEITANQDFEGTVTETVPANFTISKPGEETVTNAEIVEKEMQKPEVAGASTSASESAVAAPPAAEEKTAKQTIQSPEKIPSRLPFETTAVIGYATLNNLVDSASVKAVLGVSIPSLSLPFSGMYRVTQEFGQSLVYDEYGHGVYDTFGMHGHDGTDFAMPQGTPILAVDDGKILLAGTGDYGTTVVIQHSWGRSYYGHLSSVAVKEGDEIQRGMTIAKSGNTGLSTGPHLHFGIKPDTNESDNGFYGKVDPAYYIGLKAPAGQVLGISTKVSEEAYPAPVNTDVQILTWKIKVKKGEKIKIGYNYLAPRLSPQFYTLGPAVFTDTTGKEIFHEERKWQIAADALEYKFKRGSFTKSTCTATCTQKISGIGFKPKAIILEWTLQTTEGSSISHINVGMGLGTSNNGIQERSVTYGSEDNVGTSDTFTYRSATKIAVFTDVTTGAAASTVLAAADLASFDTDGFTLNWTTNNASEYVIHYTAVGGADVSNAKAGTFSLTTGTGSLAVTDPGFRPDFVMFLSGFTGAADSATALTGHLNIGYANNKLEDAAVSILSEDGANFADTYRQQQTSSSIQLLADTNGALDALANVTSMDATGFTLNKSDGPAVNTEIYYLALQGGQYDIGSFNKNTAAGSQAISGLGFRPSGVSFMSTANTTSSAVADEAIISLGGASTTTMHPWCNDRSGTQCTTDWTSRRKVTFNNTSSNEDLTNFPVLIKLSSASANIDFNRTQFNGQDIRFVDPSDPNIVLSHEIEKWDEPNGEALIWVKVPQIDANSRTDSLWMYYGNPSASDGQDATGVWDGSYKAVYHLKESGNGTAGEYADSTTSNLDGQGGAGTGGRIPTQTTGRIGSGENFDGTDDSISLGTSATFNLTTGGTFHAWVRPDTTGGGTFGRIVDKSTSSSGAGGYYMIMGGTTSVDLGINNTSQVNGNSGMVPLSTWSHVVTTFDGVNMKVYVNGQQDATLAAATLPPSTSVATYIGNRSGGTDRGFDGIIDEIRISNTARSADWIEAEYLSQNDSMNSYGSEETLSGGTVQYSEGSITSWDDDSPTTMELGSGTTTSKAFYMLTEPAAGSVSTLAEADIQSFDLNGFTLNWTTADATAQEIIYWAAGSITASQDDFRWYKNIDALQPTTALEDESQSTIIAKNKPYARLRASISVGGNGMNASTQGYKLQYYAQGSESGVGGTTDWCNDTTGVTCTAPLQPGDEVPASTPTDWCNDTTGVTCTTAWTTRRKITFNNLASETALTGFPVLVKLNSSRIDYNKTQNSGQDLRFVDPSDPNTVLNHEIEEFNESGSDYVWVKVNLAANSNAGYIWMYYGNASASDPATELGSSAHAQGVWNGTYRAVYHFNNGSFANSVSNNYNGTNQGTTNATGGPLGDGRAFVSASSQYIDLGNDRDIIQNTSGVTLEAWVNPTSIGAGSGSDCSNSTAGNQAIFLGNGNALDENRAGMLVCVISGNQTFGVDARAADSEPKTFGVASTDQVQTGTWQHIASTINYTNYASALSSIMLFYYNGSYQAGSYGSNNFTQATTWNSTGDFNQLGREPDGVNYFDGSLDEVRVAASVLSADWLEANYLSQADTFNTYGTEITQPEPKLSSTGWQYRKKIQFNNASASAALTDFPVLVKLDQSRIDYNKTQEDGGDIRFVDPADRTTVLAHEIESWNEGGTSYIWVKVPSLAAGSEDYIWMYYGNPTASDGQNATGVWDSNYAAVYHMKEDPSVTNCATNKEVCDSTSNANNADNTALVSGSQVSGKVNGSIDFNGTTQHLLAPDSNSLDITPNISISAWVKADDVSTWHEIVTKHVTFSNNANFGYQIEDTSKQEFYFKIGVTYYTHMSNTALATGQWYHVSVSYDQSNVRFYLNGVADGTTARAVALPTTTEALYIGNNAATERFDGTLDEIRISNSIRSADWIEAEYNNQTDQMNSFSEEQPYTTGGTAVAGWKDVADPWCSASTSCNTSWTYRKRITIDNSSSSTNLTNFPVLVKLDSSRIDYTKTQNSGQDIRFVDPNDPTTVLNHEIESWNENGESYVWVQVPQIDANSAVDSVWLYYGNASASDGQAATSVWDSNFKAVWHMNTDPTAQCATTKEACDSTSNNNDADSNNMESGDLAQAKVGKGLLFDGTNEYLRGADNSSLDITTAVTLSSWGRLDTSYGAAGTYHNILTKGGNYVLQTYGSELEFTYQNGTWQEIRTSGANLQQGVPYYFTVSFNDTTNVVSLYINGVLMHQTTSSPDFVANDPNDFCIGNQGSCNVTEQWNGYIDELRVSDIDRSADWVKAEYLTSSDQMNTFGAEETQNSTVWRFKNNASVTNGQAINTAVLGSSTTGSQLSYQESNPTTLNPVPLAAGERREFDFALDSTNASPRRTYYFRIVTAEGEPLTNYTRYPSIIVGVPHNREMRHGKWTNYKQVQPFTF